MSYPICPMQTDCTQQPTQLTEKCNDRLKRIYLYQAIEYSPALSCGPLPSGAQTCDGPFASYQDCVNQYPCAELGTPSFNGVSCVQPENRRK